MTATADRIATKQELLVAARRTAKPLPLVASRELFHCICQREHTRAVDSRDVIQCDRGRSWVPIGGE